jgi:hypothetical protein
VPDAEQLSTATATGCGLVEFKEETMLRRFLLPAGRRRLAVNALAATVMIALVPASVASASSWTMGNEAVDRGNLDGYGNFVIVDQSNSADADGLLNEVTYYAKLSQSLNQEAIAFAVVRGNQATGFNVVWISENIAKPEASGKYSYVPATSIPIKAGDNLALYSEKQGLVPYSLVTETDSQLWEFWQPNNSGKPAAGDTLSLEDPSGTGVQHRRNYSVEGWTTDCTFSVGQPIDGDGSSVFKRRGAIPVKLTPSCGDSTLAPRIAITYTGGGLAAPNETVSSVGAADAGATMRWDASAGHYVYNLATKDKDAGQYRLSFNIAGVEAASIAFGLN